jgi:hypothetical protein
MSAPVPRGCGAENGDGTERGKDRAENGVIHSLDGCAEQRQGGEEDKAACSLGVHFPRPRMEGWAHPNPPPAAW